MTDAFTHDPKITTRTTAGAVAGPETAAEHVRNALQMLQVQDEIRLLPEIGSDQWAILMQAVTNSRARLARALAALEGTGEPRSGAPL